MGNAKKITVADITPLVDEYRGNVAAIARKLKVSRGTVWNRVQESPTLQAALEDARETMLDNAESTLYSKVLSGDVTSLIFFLKTQGKGRGYSERVELGGHDGGAIEHIIRVVRDENRAHDTATDRDADASAGN